MRTFSERLDFIENNLNEHEWHNRLAKTVIDDNHSKGNSVSSFLDDVATYLLESKDIKSGRKVDNSYYRNDKDYYNNYSIGRNTTPLDTSIVEGLVDNQEVNDSDYRDYLRTLFDYADLNEETIKNLIFNWNADISECSNDFIDAWEWIHLELSEYLTESELELLEKFDGKRSISEVARICGVSQPYVSKKIKQVCTKVHKSVIFFRKKLHI